MIVSLLLTMMVAPSMAVENVQSCQCMEYWTCVLGSVIFITEPYDYISQIHMDTYDVTHHFLTDIDKINALAVDTEGRAVFAILTHNGHNTPNLVSFNYSFSQMRVLFSGPELINASVLEVYKGEALWLVATGTTSYIYNCKLRPRCNRKDLTVYKTNQHIYDFAIYHPEKQTPGENLLCEHKTCSFRCSKFTPFSSKCVCPSGMRLNPDNITCSDLPTTQPSTQSSTQTSTILSTTNGLKDLVTTSSLFMEYKLHEDKKTDGSRETSFEFFVLISIAILLIFMFGLCALNFGLYRKNAEIKKVVSQRLELNALQPGNELKVLNNEYEEIRFMQ